MFEPIERNREDVMHAWSLARTLHTRVPEEPQMASNADFRDCVTHLPELADLPLSIKRGLYVVAEGMPVPALRPLLQLVRSKPFFSDVEFARLVLKLLSEHPSPSDAVAALAAAFGDANVLSLSSPLCRRVAEVVCEGMDSPAVRRALSALVSNHGFAGSSEAQKRALLEYLLGPTLSPEVAPMRRNRVRLIWAYRVEELSRLLTSPKHRKAKPSLAQEHLRDFLCARTQQVTFLDATARNGHAAVVFGQPNNRQTLSYGRRWVMTKRRQPVARIYAPDPSVRSGWTKPMSDASVRYFGRTLKISRRNELHLINWVEKSYLFFDDLQAKGKLGHHRVSVESATLVESALSALETMMGDRPGKSSTGTYLAGHSVLERRRQPAAAASP